MSLTREKGTTRRGFVKEITAGAGGIALASSLRGALNARSKRIVCSSRADPVNRRDKIWKIFSERQAPAAKSQ